MPLLYCPRYLKIREYFFIVYIYAQEAAKVANFTASAGRVR